MQALHSLFRNAHVTHMKRNGIRSQTMRHVKSYLNGTSILNLARKCNYPPSMMARLIVENVASPPPPLLPKNPNNSSIDTTSQGDVMRGKDRIHNSNNNKSTQVSKANTINTKKFVTEAIRYPEKVLGCASTSILPEYLFSEKNGSATIINTNNNLKKREGGGQEQQSSSVLLDNFSQKPLYENNEVSYPSLSRLSLEVRWAIDMDPMYGTRLCFFLLVYMMCRYYVYPSALLARQSTHPFMSMAGPRSDRERHNVGIEYELLLEQTLRSMGEYSMKPSYIRFHDLNQSLNNRCKQTWYAFSRHSIRDRSRASCSGDGTHTRHSPLVPGRGSCSTERRNKKQPITNIDN